MGNSDSTTTADYSQLAELKNKNGVINIAVTGETGSGKSSFINALKGLCDDDEGAAKTGVTETTLEPTRYFHHSMPNVYLWDLPGIGTPNFQANQYLKDVRFETYDFFIIISSERFKENNILLAKEIKKMKKQFYFIRSKIDNDVAAGKRRRHFNEQQMLTRIRDDCVKNLEDVGDPKVFLVSSFELEKYDFQKLVDALKEDLRDNMSAVTFSPTDPDVVQAAEDFKGLTAEEATALANEQLMQLQQVKINIAVTGDTGSGKSTFINALRGLSDDDEGAAETGVTETTKESTRYSHPFMPNVYLWDLPGIGTPNFQATKYLKDVRFKTYDFFIVIASERFKENDILLAKEIKKMGKLFYFVRSKIDNDVANERRRRNFNEQQMLTRVRDDCAKNLKDVGDPKVFLVSSHALEKYDFQKLVNALMTDLDEDMGSTLIQSLPVCSVEMIRKKKKMLTRVIWLLCFASAGGAMVPVPGLSVAADIGIMVSFFTQCYHAFGLDDNSLRMLCTKANKTEAELRAAMKSIFADGITKELVIRFAGSAAVGVAMTLEFFLSMIPVVGTVMAGGLSFTTTYILLDKGMRNMAEAAERMLKAAGLA